MPSHHEPGVRLPELSATKRALLEAMTAGRRRPSALVRRAHQGEIPLSFAQERLYFLDRMRPGSTAYHFHTALRLPGGTDEAALERALGEIVRRHEVLRTTFRERDGVPAQVIAPHGASCCRWWSCPGWGRRSAGRR